MTRRDWKRNRGDIKTRKKNKRKFVDGKRKSVRYGV
jgi:hypothetical protein